MPLHLRVRPAVRRVDVHDLSIVRRALVDGPLHVLVVAVVVPRDVCPFEELEARRDVFLCPFVVVVGVDIDHVRLHPRLKEQLQGCVSQIGDRER